MELRDYLRGLRRHWLAVVLMTAVGVLTAFAWASLQTPVYESTANGLVQSKATASQGGAIYGDSYANSKVPTFLEMATWKIVAQTAAKELNLNESPDQLASRVTVINPSGTSILKFTAQANSPQAAAALAQAWIDALGKTIDTVDGTGTAGSSPISIYSAAAATVSSAPIFPDKRTALLVGGVLGLGVGIAFALVRTASDRRIRPADDVQTRIGIPVVGTIPASTALSVDHRLLDPSRTGEKGGGGSALAEALRSLRTNLRFMDVDNPPRTIVVTSPLPADGKSTIACNLAVTLAASGESVVLVDGDMRRPTVAKTMGLPTDAGLSDVLAGRVDLADVLQRTGTENLKVLAAGSIPPNPSELLGSARMRQVLDDLAADAIVIIDAPPVLPVTDGSVLTHQADGALMAISVGKTTYDIVDKAIDTLHKAHGRVLGLVLNKAPLKGMDAPSYSHAYREGYLATAQPIAPGSAELPVSAFTAAVEPSPDVADAPQDRATKSSPKRTAAAVDATSPESASPTPAPVDPGVSEEPVPEVVDAAESHTAASDAEEFSFDDFLSTSIDDEPGVSNRRTRRGSHAMNTDA